MITKAADVPRIDVWTEQLQGLRSKLRMETSFFETRSTDQIFHRVEENRSNVLAELHLITTVPNAYHDLRTEFETNKSFPVSNLSTQRCRRYQYSNREHLKFDLPSPPTPAS